MKLFAKSKDLLTYYQRIFNLEIIRNTGIIIEY